MKLKQMTNERLIVEFSQRLSANNLLLLQASEIWMEMRERRMDLSKFPSSFHKVMPLIAAKKLLPEVVLELAGENTKMLLLSKFPIAEQKAIIKGKELPVVRNGETEHRPIYALEAAEAKRVLRDGKIQPPAKQKAELKAASNSPLPLKPEAVAAMRTTSWRQAFKEMWRRGTDEDRKWAKAWLKA